MKQVLSYGAGVQTCALLRMSVEGLLPRVDAVLFGDTGGEPEHVYRALQRDKEYCEAHGIHFARVQYKSLIDLKTLKTKAGRQQLFAPLFTINLKTGKHGQLLRSCTQRFKIAPVRAYVAQVLRWKKEGAQMWLGMSTDEIERVKPSNVQWAPNWHPLIELNWRRGDCERFLLERGIKPAKSACVMCPYRSNVQWLEIKANPRDWAVAVRYDRMIRNARPGFLTFCHPARIPLDAVDFVDEKQIGLWDAECEGVCAA